MPVSTEVARARGRVAGYKRAIKNGERAADDPVCSEANRDLNVAKLTSDADRLAIRAQEIVATWPELTDTQRDRLAAILRAGGDSERAQRVHPEKRTPAAQR
jgi:hypothetical protein